MNCKNGHLAICFKDHATALQQNHQETINRSCGPAHSQDISAICQKKKSLLAKNKIVLILSIYLTVRQVLQKSILIRDYMQPLRKACRAMERISNSIQQYEMEMAGGAQNAPFRLNFFRIHSTAQARKCDLRCSLGAPESARPVVKGRRLLPLCLLAARQPRFDQQSQCRRDLVSC
jgi:hypothetical protein